MTRPSLQSLRWHVAQEVAHLCSGMGLDPKRLSVDARIDDGVLHVLVVEREGCGFGTLFDERYPASACEVGDLPRLFRAAILTQCGVAPAFATVA